MAKDIDSSLKDLQKINGFIGGAIVDAESGMSLGTIGGNAKFDIEIAAAANKDVVAAKLAAASALGLSDSIDDILITLGTQYHLIRPLPNNPAIFIYLCVDRATSNLALARIAVNKVATEVRF